MIQAGIWNRPTLLKIENPEAEKWLLRVKEAEVGEGQAKAITIAEILDQSGADRIEISEARHRRGGKRGFLERYGLA